MFRRLFFPSCVRGRLLLVQLFCVAAFFRTQEDIILADLVHLKSGSVVDIGWDYHTKADKLIIQKKEGTIAISLSDVERLEKTQPVRSSASSKAEEIQQPKEEVEPGRPAGEEGREVLRRVIQEALGFLGQLESSSEITEEIKQEGLEISEVWIQDARSTMQGDAEEETMRSAESLIRILEDLQTDLRSAILDRGKGKEESLRELLERI